MIVQVRLTITKEGLILLKNQTLKVFIEISTSNGIFPIQASKFFREYGNF
jgi:hypothetical protein